eukprot:TRINITY_DN4924_c0_g1_i3.p1 TRINITY_DN4924_c0_g1~~TRINITY_DN4924_c0_g1_i3.p1  ORF type:complete len:132 (-),score=33.92 TRINITY_DN4924_c0_g1_i3:269-664(-)
MAKKKKSNKKRDAAVSMEFSTDTNLPQGTKLSAGKLNSKAPDRAQEMCKTALNLLLLASKSMDTTEVTVSKPVLGVVNRKIKKEAAMKRSKNLRKMKAIEKAISKSEQSEEKISKSKIKVQRIQSAKSLYD